MKTWYRVRLTLDGVKEVAARKAMPGLLRDIQGHETISSAHGHWDDSLGKPVLELVLSASSPESANTEAVNVVFRIANFEDADDVWIRDGGVEPFGPPQSPLMGQAGRQQEGIHKVQSDAMGDAEPVYPIVVADRKAQEMFGFQSFQSVQEELEIVDVEYGLYEAWDSLGRPLVLRPTPGKHYVGATESLVELFSWLFSRLFRRKREPDQVDVYDGWLAVTVVSPEPDPSLLPKLRSFLAVNGYDINDDDALAQLISHLSTVSGL